MASSYPSPKKALINKGAKTNNIKLPKLDTPKLNLAYKE